MLESTFPKQLAATLAALFAAATILCSVLWTYNNYRPIPLELGFDNEYLKAEHCELVKSVQSGGPAERAGLRPGDRIIAINGRLIKNALSLVNVWSRHHPGNTVKLTIQRPQVPAPFVIMRKFRAPHTSSQEGRVAEDVGLDIANAYPVGFLVVGMAVLFLRLEDRNAWLLALMFAGFIAIPNSRNSFAGLSPSLRSFALAYRGLFDNLVTPLFYFFSRSSPPASRSIAAFLG
jgi:PDZ domain